MGNIWSNPRVETFIRQIRKTAITLNALKINVNSRPPAFLTIFANLVLMQQTTVSHLIRPVNYVQKRWGCRGVSYFNMLMNRIIIY